MSCGTCGVPDISQCGCKDQGRCREVWQPSLTVDRACSLVHTLLNSTGCKVECPDWELCRLIKLQCELCGGKYPVATLAMLAAAQMLETEALTFARRGNVKTLTLTYNGNQSAEMLCKIAEKWRENAMKCVPRRRFAIVGTGKSCLQGYQAFNACDCKIKASKIDDVIMTDCNWDCCEGCD